MTARQRDEGFVTEALREYGGQIYRTALALTRSPADAQDVVQDTFIALMTSNRGFSDREHLRAWLLRVAINRCRALARSAWSRKVESADCPGALERLADPRSESSEEKVFDHPVWAALEKLPEDLRVVIHLHYVEELPCKEVARALGVPAVTVRTRLHRARARLRAALEPTEPERSAR